MLNTTISRRAFMTASASTAGLTALAAGLPLASGLLGTGAIEKQKSHMISVLHQYTGHTRHIKPETIELFANRFAEVYGAVDYQQYFAGPLGEHRLIKLFLKSVFRPA